MDGSFFISLLVKISSQTLLFIVFSKVEKSEERNLIVRSYC